MLTVGVARTERVSSDRTLEQLYRDRGDRL
jgi:hypothetical protein